MSYLKLISVRGLLTLILIIESVASRCLARRQVLGSGLGSTTYVKFLEDMPQMDANCASRNICLASDFLIGESLCEQFKKLCFARRQANCIRRGRWHSK